MAFTLQYKLRKRGIFVLIAGGAVFLLVPYLYRYISHNRFYSAPFFMVGWYSFSYVLLCAALFLIMYFSFRISAKELLLVLCISYMLQNAIYNATRIVGDFFPGIGGTAMNGIALALVLAVCVLIYILGKKNILNFDLSRVKTPVVVVFSLGIILLFTIISQYMGAYRTATNNALVGMHIYAGIASLFLLCILIAVFNNGRLQYENAVINELLKKTEKQHKISRENIEYINGKVHDLKHQIAAIKNMIASGIVTPETHEKLSELEKTAKVYDDTVYTGNNILDSLLTEHKIYCENNNIHLDYVIDGAALSFLEPVDMYVIFGNALDNAAESVLKIDDAEKRIITINAGRSGGFVNIRIENPYSGEISFVNGIPHTSKEGESFHGFGIKSIRYIVKKYGGNVAISTEDNVFTLSILIPAEKEKAA